MAKRGGTCHPLNLPLKMVAKYQNFVIKLKKRLKSFDIEDDDILPIIKNLNVDKAHEWNQLSIRMIKACDNSISFQLEAYL